MRDRVTKGGSTGVVPRTSTRLQMSRTGYVPEFYVYRCPNSRPGRSTYICVRKRTCLAQAVAVHSMPPASSHIPPSPRCTMHTYQVRSLRSCCPFLITKTILISSNRAQLLLRFPHSRTKIAATSLHLRFIARVFCPTARLPPPPPPLQDSPHINIPS